VNLHRRHLTESQRAMVAAKIANMKHGGDRGSNQHGTRQAADLPLASTQVNQAQAAKQLNIGEREKWMAEFRHPLSITS
jgi:hypothetical protein